MSPGDAAEVTFDIGDRLPTGTTLLEASAGTGKTWTIGALVARYVAEGVSPLEEMLVVTFGRAASEELRERVRAHLRRAEAALGDALAAHEQAGRSADEGLVADGLDADAAASVRDVTAGEVARRRDRLREALGSFDAATIATTHQFCRLVLRSLGVAGDTDPDARLVEDLDPLLVDVVDDLYIRGFAGTAGRPVFTRAQALEIARAVVGDPQAGIEPADVPPDSPPGRRAGFARAVRTEMRRRMRRLGLLGYDDLLSQVADALTAADAPARERMRRRWRVVLVDEFQDTDPVQWDVLDRAFSGHATMILIGDPKQAVYAFRGGDVVTYLKAARTAVERRTLARNYRTDEPLVGALGVVLEGACLGDDEIVVRPVSAEHGGSRLAGAPVDHPLRLRVLTRADLGASAGALLRVGDVRPRVARDVALDIAGLLGSGATFDGAPLRPSDVAVLAHTSRQLAYVQQALRDAGLASVVAGEGSVYHTDAAADWLAVLRAMEQPQRAPLVRAAALTDLVGLDAAALDAGGDDLTDELAARMRDWATLFEARGVAAVLEASAAGGLARRALARPGGERTLTDLRHVAQELHQWCLTDRLGLVSVIARLREQIGREVPEAATARRRRLDSDATAVQLATIHASKGLQYPVVYLPFLADRWAGDPSVPRFHGPPPQRYRSLDVGGAHPGRARSLRAARAEEDGESLRLAYVALTRAQSQVVAWWSPTRNAECAPLHRLLLGRGPGAGPVPDTVRVPRDDVALTRLRAWEARGGPKVEAVADPPPAPLVPIATPGGLTVRRFDRIVDLRWRRTSYSALSRAGEAAAEVVVGSEPEVEPRADEHDGDAGPVAPGAAAGPDMASPMTGLPVGATFGSLVHAVLEEADASAADLRAELRRAIEAAALRWPAGADPQLLADALTRVCTSPLGPLAGHRSLADISRRDRLREMEFELPLAGDDVRLGHLAGLLRRHLPDGDPVRPYADRLDGTVLGEQPLSGYLTGSVDVVLRVGDRHLVVDYKTNWLGPLHEPLSVAAYAPAALAAAMMRGDYPLQALLYAVVLHRFLRWRRPGYEPARHLGGVLYLYLRGMCGPETPIVDGHPCGVFAWRPPAALVLALSDLLDGAVPGQRP